MPIFSCLTILSRFDTLNDPNQKTAESNAIIITVVPAKWKSTHSINVSMEKLHVSGIMGEKIALLSSWDIFESSAIFPPTESLNMLESSESKNQ